MTKDNSLYRHNINLLGIRGVSPGGLPFSGQADAGISSAPVGENEREQDQEQQEYNQQSDDEVFHEHVASRNPVLGLLVAGMRPVDGADGTQCLRGTKGNRLPSLPPLPARVPAPLGPPTRERKYTEALENILESTSMTSSLL